MKQAALALNLNAKKTRKREFLEQMEHVVPWAASAELIASFYPEGRTSSPPFSLATMLRIHFMQQWFSLSDPAMEEAFFDTPLYCEFAQLEEFGRLPDESTILRFRHRLEKHKLATQILLSIPHRLWRYGIKKRPDAKSDLNWQIAMRPGKRKALGKENAADALIDQAEKIKAGIKTKVEHLSQTIKRQFEFIKVRYKGLKKNTAQLITLFALSNLWRVRTKLIGIGA